MAQNKLLLLYTIATAAELVTIGRRSLKADEARPDRLILQYMILPWRPRRCW